MKDLKYQLEAWIKTHGLSMTKKISSGGFLIPATYDDRKIYSLEDLRKLTKEGFYVNEDMDIFILNVIINN